ncbi:hypothetical protein SEUCBS139899_009328 [Sporothrix eucalyptigena]
MAPTLRAVRAAKPDHGSNRQTSSSILSSHLDLQPRQAKDLRLSSAFLATRAADNAPAAVVERAATTTSLIPAVYGSTQSGLSAGVIVGITLGSVGGFLLLMALLYTCVNFGNGGASRGIFAGGGSVVETASSFGGASSFVSRREDRRTRRHRHTSRRRRSGRRETVEIRGSRVRPIIVDPPRGERVERVVVEEERIRRTGGGGRPGPSVVETVDSDDDEIVVEEEESNRRRRPRPRDESDDDSDDEVVVIEDNSSVPTRGGSRRARSSRTGGSRRTSRRDSASRR